VTDLYLALETATDRPSLALGSPGSPGGDRRVASRHELSREIERLATALLGEHGIAARDLAGVAVADGPGSFTGLRIGIAFAKGLCRAAGLGLFTAPSLMAAARQAARGYEPVVVEYDALRGEVFRAAYRFLPDVEVLATPALVAADVPSGYPGAARATTADASAAALLTLIGVAGGAVRVADPAAWEPAYGRMAEAEARYRARGSARGA
jgi:tRNA threonylcarbamoyl adenosine modification protein YeaZ